MPRRYTVSASGQTVAAASDFLQINGFMKITDGASTTATKVLTSASNPFTKDMVGKSVYVVSGTNFTATQWATIATFTSAGSVTLNIDPTTGSNGSAGIILISARNLRILRWWIMPSDNTLATEQIIQVRARRFDPLVTVGNGTLITPAANPTQFEPKDPTDPAAAFCAIVNSSSKATTTGTAGIDYDGGFDTKAGIDIADDSPVIVTDRGCWVLEMLSAAIQGTPKFSYGALVEETGS